MGIGERRSRWDYSLVFKLSVVNKIEKGKMAYKHVQVAMEYRVSTVESGCASDR